IIKDLWERHEEAVVSLLTSGHPLKVTEILKAAQKAVKEDLALNKKVLEANKAYTRNYNNITKLLCLAKTFDFSGLKEHDAIEDDSKKPEFDKAKEEPTNAVPISTVKPTETPKT
ncbi:hypothetical protein Tco_1498873, partial [Tanacetum coccineum]